MATNAKEKIMDTIKTEEFEGCKINDKGCLISVFFNKIPKSEILRLKQHLFDENLLLLMKDEDLIASVDEFFKNNLNISETSRNAFLHRNTLIYRLEKIEKITGFNLKNFSDAVTFKILMMIYKQI